MSAQEVQVTLPENVKLSVLWVNKKGQVVSAQTYGPLTKKR